MPTGPGTAERRTLAPQPHGNLVMRARLALLLVLSSIAAATVFPSVAAAASPTDGAGEISTAIAGGPGGVVERRSAGVADGDVPVSGDAETAADPTGPASAPGLDAPELDDPGADGRSAAEGPQAAITAAPPSEHDRAVAAALAGINSARRSAGLRPLWVDGRMTAIAQARANTMAAEGRMAHASATGVSAFHLLEQRRITWYQAGEIIAWNTWPGLADSAASASRCWMASLPHRAVILSGAYNYIGLALTVGNDGGRFWSAVFLRGPDRTAPRVKPVLVTPAALPARTGSSTARPVVISWSGGDVRLATLTSGLRHFTIVRRVDGGPWRLLQRTRWHHHPTLAPAGRRVEYRVRGVDRAGNVGAWSEAGVVEP